MGIMSFFGRGNKYDPSANKTGVDGLWYEMPDAILEARLLRYSANWRAYLEPGNDATRTKKAPNAQKEGQTQAAGNYNATTVNRMNTFAFGKPWKVSLDYDPVDDGGQYAGAAEQEVKLSPEVVSQRAKLAEMLRFAHNVFHKENPGDANRLEAALFSSVCGDAYMVAMPVLSDSLEFTLIEGDMRPDLMHTDIRVMVVNSAHCVPEYAPDGITMVRFTMEYPVAIPGQQRAGKFKQVVTSAQIVEETLTHDGGLVNTTTKKNPIGRVYACHIKNYPFPGIFGIDDIRMVKGLNQEINDKISDMSDIIDYHAAPITLVFGARISSLEKGANKLWSGLPKDGKVETLKLDGDLTAAAAFVNGLRETIRETTGVNSAALGSDMSISNTSGVALHIRFYAMFSVAELKWAAWAFPLKNFYTTLLAWGKYLKRIDYTPDDLRRFRDALTIDFQSNLPKDQLLQIQGVAERVNAKLLSRLSGMAELGTKDPQAEQAQIVRESAQDSAQTATAVAKPTNMDKTQGPTGRNISNLREPSEASPNA